jgi:hypothetical protein
MSGSAEISVRKKEMLGLIVKKEQAVKKEPRTN